MWGCLGSSIHWQDQLWVLQLQLGQRDGHAIAPSAVQRALVCCFEFFVAPEAGTVARGVHGDEDGAETTQRPEWNHNSSFPAGGPSQLGQALTSQNCPDVPLSCGTARAVLQPKNLVFSASCTFSVHSACAGWKEGSRRSSGPESLLPLNGVPSMRDPGIR